MTCRISPKKKGTTATDSTDSTDKVKQEEREGEKKKEEGKSFL